MNSYKGLIFAGCSFTWGQGLYYYSGLESLVYNDNTFRMRDLTEGQIKFMESKRFPRIVANHFNTFETVSVANGGSDKSNILTWYQVIGGNKNPFSDYSHLVFQLTQPHRSFTPFEYDGKKINFCPFTKEDINFNHNNEIFFKWLDDKKMSFDEWFVGHVKETLHFVKKRLYHFEENGIKTFVMTWPDIYLEHIFNDAFLKDRFINFTYQNNVFNSLEQLLNESGMKISTDFKNLERQINDDHPSLECHKIIAESIIKKIS